jgi:ribosome modulation factor
MPLISSVASKPDRNQQEASVAATKPNITPNQISEFMREIAQQERKVDEAVAVRRTILKRAKAAGAPTEAMLAVNKMMKLDPEEAAAKLRAIIQVSAIRGRKFEQTDLFADFDNTVTGRAAEADDMWIVNEEGYQAGRAGVTRESCKYAPGSAKRQEWDRAWLDGQRAIAEEMGPEGSVADSTKTRAPRPGSKPVERLMPPADAAPLPPPSQPSGSKADDGGKKQKSAETKVKKPSRLGTATVSPVSPVTANPAHGRATRGSRIN